MAGGKRVSHIRHDASDLASFTGVEAELTVNSTSNAVVVHDATTPGGHEMAKKDLTNIPVATSSADGKMSAAQVASLLAVIIDTATNAANIAANVNNIANNGVAIANLSANLTNQIDINRTDIADNSAAIAANIQDINDNITTLAAHASSILTNANDIIGLAADINTNSTAISNLGVTVTNLDAAKPDKPAGSATSNLLITDAAGNVVTSSENLADVHDAANLTGDIAPFRLPIATTLNRGALEVADGADNLARDDFSVAITAGLLPQMDATTQLSGLAELATQAEVNAGLVDNKIVTPETLKNVAYASVTDFSVMPVLYLKDSGAGASPFVLTTAVVAPGTATADIGPTGSPSLFDWPALDSLPSGIKSYKIKVSATLLGVGNMTMSLEMGNLGVALPRVPPVFVFEEFARANYTLTSDGLDIDTVYDVPCDADGRFGAYWDLVGAGTPGPASIKLELIGFYI